MAQLQLPVFPAGVTQLSPDLGVSCRDGRVTYFYGTLPVFTHGEKDVKSFRLFTSQLLTRSRVKKANAYHFTSPRGASSAAPATKREPHCLSR